jgi:hypothetical protein
MTPRDISDSTEWSKTFLMGRKYERDYILKRLREEIADGLEDSFILRQFMKEVGGELNSAHTTQEDGMTERIRDYRIKIIKQGNIYTFETYIYRKGSLVFYIDAEETPLALSNLLGAAAAETRFRLEDAPDGNDALIILREALLKKFVTPGRMPKVYLFSVSTGRWSEDNS